MLAGYPAELTHLKAKTTENKERILNIYHNELQDLNKTTSWPTIKSSEATSRAISYHKKLGTSPKTYLAFNSDQMFCPYLMTLYIMG